LLSDGTFQRDDGIEVAEAGDHTWVGVIICRYVNSLEGGDRTTLGGGDAFL